MIYILRHVKGNSGQELLYENKGNTEVLEYCDANWVGCLVGTRSTTRYCIFLGGSLLSSKSKKERVVARSSAEAEY